MVVDKDNEYDPIEELCNAIVQRAVIDYRRALSINHQSDIESLERFFKSDFYLRLTSVPGEYLISKIRKEFNK